MTHFISAVLESPDIKISEFVQAGGSDLIELAPAPDGACIHVLPSVPKMWFVEAELNEQCYLAGKNPAERVHSSMRHCS